MAADVTALTHWRRGRDQHTREVVKHERVSELPHEVKALLVRMNARIEQQGRQVTALRQALELLAQAASEGH